MSIQDMSFKLPEMSSFSNVNIFNFGGKPEGGASNDGVGGFDPANMVASVLSESLFEKSGNGAKIRDADNPLLKSVAEFMDKNPGKFDKPHDANGKVRNWSDELSEDNYLNAEEKETFTKGLEGYMKDLLSGGAEDPQNPGGWSPFKEAEKQDEAVRSGAGLQELLSALLANLGSQKLDNLLKPAGEKDRDARGEKAFSNDDKDLLKEVVRFMDMHPEEFGKPDGKSKDWMGELSEGDQFMSGPEAEQFQKAIDMIKGEIKDASHGNTLGGLFPDAEQNFKNGGAGNTLKTDAGITADNVLSVLMQQSVSKERS